MKKSIKRVIIALNLHLLDTPGLVSFLRAIIKALTGNTYFLPADIAKLPVTIADMGTQATNLESTHTSRKTNKSATLTSTEQDQVTLVMNTIGDTADFVEGLGNKKAAGDLSLAVQIITSAGFQVKKEFVVHQRTFEIVDVAKKQVHIRTKAAGARASYIWQGSANPSDPGSWSFPIVTIEAEVIITSLTSGTNYGFRVATILPTRKPTIALGSQPDWSDVIMVIVP